MKRFLVIAAVAASLISVSCSLKKDMEEAKEATQDMRGATHRLEELTRSVETSSNNIYLDGREGGTMNMLRESFNQMLKGGRKNVVRKIEYASIYFCSFEYQFWRSSGSDDTAYRELLMAKAVDLFFAEIDDLIDEDFPISVFNVWSKSFDNWLNLSVLAMAMDRVHDRQVITAKEQNFKIYSMLDLITRGLEYKTMAQQGQKIPEFANKVLQREQQAIYLLQLRHNFYPLIVLGLATDFDEGLFEMATKTYLPWSFDFSFANERQIFMWSEFLIRAHETRDWLTSHGVRLVMNEQMRGAFQGIRKVILPAKDSGSRLEQVSSEFLRLLRTEGVRVHNSVQ